MAAGPSCDVESRRLARYREPRGEAYVRVDGPDSAAPLEVGALPGVDVDLGGAFAY